MPIRLEVITAERVVFSEDVDVIIAPAADGQISILPHHAPLITALAHGELVARKGGEEFSLAIGRGFLEVRPDRVVVLADVAERAEEIDIERAEAARRRAAERLRMPPHDLDLTRAEASMRKAMARIRVAERRRRRMPQPPV